MLCYVDFLNTTLKHTFTTTERAVPSCAKKDTTIEPIKKKKRGTYSTTSFQHTHKKRCPDVFLSTQQENKKKKEANK